MFYYYMYTTTAANNFYHYHYHYHIISNGLLLISEPSHPQVYRGGLN